MTLGAARLARADGPATPLRIECPALDPEGRAALEARARAEMALSPLPAGEIAIACEIDLAHVGWRAADGGLHEREVGLGSNAAVNVDSLLGALHALRFGDSTPRPPAAAPPHVTVVAPTPPAPAGAGPGVGLVVALHSERWAGSLAGAIEAQLGLRLAWRERWSLVAVGGLGRGLESAEGIQVRTLRAMVSVGYVLGRPARGHFDLRVGGEWHALNPALAGGTLSRPTAATGGLFTAPRYVFSGGRFRLAAGPYLGLAAAPIIVEVETREVFRIPRLVAGFSLAGEADLIR